MTPAQLQAQWLANNKPTICNEPKPITATTEQLNMERQLLTAMRKPVIEEFHERNAKRIPNPRAKFFPTSHDITTYQY